MNIVQKRYQIFLLCVVGGGALIMFLPFLWLMLSTFKHTDEIISVPPSFFPKEWTVNNYVETITKFNITRYFGNSIFLASIKTFIGVYTSLLCGFVFAKYNFKYKNTIFIVILFTMMVPYLIMVIPLYEMMNMFRLIDRYIAVILPTLYSSFGIFMMRQYMQYGIPNELIEAARMEGASEWRIFHSIAIPLSVNMISALSIFLFLWNWEDFLWPYLVLVSQDKFPLAVALSYFSGQNNTNYGGLFATTAITIIPILVVYLFFQKRFVEGVSLSGIK